MGLFGLIVLGLFVDLQEPANSNIPSNKHMTFLDFTLPEF